MDDLLHNFATYLEVTNMLMAVIEVTATLIMAYLILVNAGGFAQAVAAAGSAYTGAVTTLQGR